MSKGVEFCGILATLTLGVPLVVCRNDTRPLSVIAHPGDKSQDSRQIGNVVAHRVEVAQSLTGGYIHDMLAHETELLTSHS